MPIAMIIPLEGFTPGLTPGWPLPQPPLIPGMPLPIPPPPLYPSQGPGFPTHPIAGGGGGGGNRPSQGPGFPSQLPMPGGGGSGGRPDNTLPGQQPHPSNPITTEGWVLMFHPAYGYHWVPASQVGSNVPHPDQGLPEQPEQPEEPYPEPHSYT